MTKQVQATEWGNVSWGDTPEWGAPVPKARPVKGQGLTESQLRISARDASGQRVLSATLLQAFTECQRKFLFKYLEGEIEDDVSAMRLGTRVHKIAEEYLEKGTYPFLGESMELPDRRAVNKDGTPKINTYYPGQIFESGIYLLPAPGIVQVEKSFTLVTPGSSWKGQKDGAYFLDDGDKPVAELTSIPVVLDHKTTSGARTAKEPFGPYSKAPETRVVKGYKGEYLVTGLADDIQAILYCYETLSRYQTDHVLARWIYYLTTGQKRDAWASEYLFSKPELERKMAGLDTMALECHSVLTSGALAKDVEPNTSACDKFGGCPFSAARGGPCLLSIGQIVNGGKNTMDVATMIADLKAKQEALAAGGGMVQPALPIASGAISQPALPTIAQPALPTLIAAQPALPMTAAPQVAQAPYWRPGMALNAVQAYLQAQGMPWSAIAGQADVKPPAEVMALYDTAYDKAGNQLVPGTSPGILNPPEAPHLAPPNPAAMPSVVPVAVATAAPTIAQVMAPPPALPATRDDLTDLTDREAVKAYALALNCVPANTRLRIDALKEAIRAHWAGPYGRNAAPAVMADEAQPALPATALVAPAALTPAAVEAITPTPNSPTPAQLTSAHGAHGFCLYINCIPVIGGQAHNVYLDVMLSEIIPKVNAALGVSDYRLADYGKGQGAMCSVLDAYLKEMAWGADVAIFVDSRNPEGALCLSTLMRHAALVVRSVGA